VTAFVSQLRQQEAQKVQAETEALQNELQRLQQQEKNADKLRERIGSRVASLKEKAHGLELLQAEKKQMEDKVSQMRATTSCDIDPWSCMPLWLRLRHVQLAGASVVPCSMNSKVAFQWADYQSVQDSCSMLAKLAMLNCAVAWSTFKY
jgi:hypothetical protein